MCIFCKIANLEIPSNIVYEDKDFLAFYDINPLTEGHTILISKEHFPNMLEASDSVLQKALPVLKIIGNQLIAKHHALGMNFDSNINEVAGQTVFHMHFHLIPRYQKDELIKQ
jgi:histidine triad (HIT) family protein